MAVGDERGASKLWSIGVALLGGVAAAVAPSAPTGSALIDTVILFGLGVLLVWASSHVPWWLLAIAGAVAAALASGAWVVAGVAAIIVAFLAALRPDALIRAVSGVLLALALGHMPGAYFLGSSAVVAGVVGLVVVGAGLSANPDVRRWHVVVGFGTVALVGVLGAAGLGLAGVRAKDALTSGRDEAKAAVQALRDGDFDTARSLFTEAEADFSDAHDALTAPWAWPSAVVPVLAQHRRLGADLTATAVDLLDAAEGAAAQIDQDKLHLTKGTIDVQAVRDLEAPLTTVQEALVGLDLALTEDRSPWILSTITDKLDELAGDFRPYDEQANNAVELVRRAPDLLGAGTPRKFFVAFTTPAEARGLGGFMGNYAILTLDDGTITLSDFGRSDDLIAAAEANPSGVRLEGLDDFLQRYGRFGFADITTGLVDPVAWKNITAAPDMATVSRVISQMYAQSGGTAVDGVIVMDPYVIAALLRYTGPIMVVGAPLPLTSDNVTQFLLKDQYDISDKDARVDLLEVTARVTLEKILGGALPAPVQLAKDLGPLTKTDRLMIWSDDAGEEHLLNTLGISGHFPAAPVPGGFAYSVNNAGGNKLDAYLDVAATCTELVEAEGAVTTQVQLIIGNDAPPDGLPLYVYGIPVNGVLGTNRMFLSVFSASPPVRVQRDGSALLVESGTEGGVAVVSSFLDIPPARSTTITLVYNSTRAVEGCSIRQPPLPLG